MAFRLRRSTGIGKVLAAIAHAGQQHAVHDALGQQRHHARVAVKAAVADDAAGAVVQVEHRGKAEVDAAGAQLAGQHEAGAARHLRRPHRIAHPQLAQRAHGRQAGEAVAAKALHPSALVVDADEHIGPQRLDLAVERAHLRAVLPVAAEMDHAAHQRVGQAAAVDGRELGAGDVDDERRLDRGVGAHAASFFSTTTKLAA
jgi:hypothetical protein